MREPLIDPLSDPLLRGLSDEQRAVVLAPAAPVLVLAGAGSGKTRALVHRVAHLLRAGAAPGRVLLMTFTAAAAREMIGRAAALLGDGGPARDERDERDGRAASSSAPGPLGELWAGTFHHVALRLLRRHGHHLGLPPGFAVLDRRDAEELLGSCIERAGGGALRPRLLARLLTLSVGGERPLHEVVPRAAPPLAEQLPLLRRVLDDYARRKLQMGALDFDDLLLYLRLLLCDHRDVADEASERFQHILVDEYQDTSPLEAALVDELGRAHRSVLVVGDDAQAIYRFRGGDVGGILGFPARWGGALVLELRANYRSGPQIVALANASIARNRRRYDKTMRAARGETARPALVPLAGEEAQSAFVAARIGDLLRAGRRPGDIAVLYRAHAHAEALQRELQLRRLPFRLRSGAPLLEQAHVKDALCHLRLVASPRDSLALRRALRLRLGERLADRLAADLGAGGGGGGPGGGGPGGGGLGGDGLGGGGLGGGGPGGGGPGGGGLGGDGLGGDGLGGGGLAAGDVGALGRALGALGRRESLPPLLELGALLEELAELAAGGAPPAALLARVVQDYAAHARRSFPDAEGRLAGLARLGEALRGPLCDALAELPLRGVESDGDEPGDAVTLSTVHRAKGLEWPVVFVIALGEGRFPSRPSHGQLDPQGADEEMEEERRLFYVAVTRARDELYLCCPAGRASRFLRELDGPSCPYERWQVVMGGEAP